MDKNIVKSNIISGTVGLIISVFLIFHFTDIVSFLTNIAEEYFSQDKHIGQRSIIFINIITISSILFIITLSYFFIFNLTKKVSKFISAFFQINNPLTTNICNKRYLDLYIMVIGTLLGAFQIYYLIIFGEPMGESFIPTSPANEGIMEKVFALLLLFSIIFLLSSVTRVKREIYSAKMRRKIIFLLIVFSGMIILILGEEISWGQRISGLDSFGIFNEYNYQNETNIHNFLSPNTLVGYIYPIVGLGSFIVLFLIWLIPKKRNSYFFNLFFPHPSLFFLVLMMMVLSFFGGGGETYEQLFTIFVLLYSFRIFMCLSFPKTDLSNH